MNGAKLAGLVVLGLVLFGVVGAANAVTTTERTALNADYVTERIESEGSYDAIRNATIDEVVNRMENANLSAGQQLLQAGNGTDNRTLVADAVTTEYIEEEASENIRALYEYLHGKEDSLNMQIDMRPLKENLAASFAGQVEEKDTSTLVEEFGPSGQDTPVPVDGALVEQMQSGPQGYEKARLDFRVDVGWEVTSNDEKLRLIGENPRRYNEQEKERIVQNREQEIRDAIRQELGDESSPLASRVEQEVQQRRADAKESVCDSTVSELNPDAGQQVCSDFYQDGPDTTHLDNVTRAAVEVQYVVIDGLTRDTALYDYEEFDSDLTQSEDHLANETGDLAQSRIEEEVPDTLSAQDQFGEDTTNTLKDAQGTVGLVDTLNLALPIVALLLVALAYGITRSVETTATFTGIVLALTGGLHLIVATVLGGTVLSAIESAVEDAGASEFADLAVTIFEGMLGALATQSIALLVVGVVFIGLAYASKNGQLDGLKARVADVRGDSGGATAPPQQTQRPEQGQQHGQTQSQQQHGQAQQGQQGSQPQGQHSQQRGQQPRQGGQHSPQQGDQQRGQQGGHNQGQHGQNRGSQNRENQDRDGQNNEEQN